MRPRSALPRRTVGLCLLGTAAVVATLAAVGGCGGSQTNYGQQYLSLIGPYNAASATFLNSYAAHPNWSATQVIDAEQTQFTAGAKMDSKLVSAHWPANTQPDISSFVRANQVYFVDLHNVAITNTALATAQNAVITLDNKIRLDLKLSAVSTTLTDPSAASDP